MLSSEHVSLVVLTAVAAWSALDSWVPDVGWVVSTPWVTLLVLVVGALAISDRVASLGSSAKLPARTVLMWALVAAIVLSAANPWVMLVVGLVLGRGIQAQHMSR